jgi:hypothetical protein
MLPGQVATRTEWVKLFLNAPRVGLEPTTLKLTASCSAIELPGNIKFLITELYQPILKNSRY